MNTILAATDLLTWRLHKIEKEFYRSFDLIDQIFRNIEPLDFGLGFAELELKDQGLPIRKDLFEP